MRINVPNHTGMPIYVGSVMIPAGESRDFEEHDVPLHLRPVAAAPATEPAKPADPAAVRKAELEELLTHTVGDVRESVANLSNEDLTALEAMEGAADTPRKTLLEAIAEELLQRAGAG